MPWCAYWIPQQKPEPLPATVTVERLAQSIQFNSVGAGDWNGRYCASVMTCTPCFTRDGPTVIPLQVPEKRLSQHHLPGGACGWHRVRRPARRVRSVRG